MNTWQNPQQNMYGNPAMGNVWNRVQAPLQRYEAPQLHGRSDANMFQMAPGSEIYLPDATEDIIWWIRIDQMGNRTVVPFDVTLHHDPDPVDLNALVARLTAVEEKLNAKSNKSNAKRTSANASATPVPDNTIAVTTE